MRRRVVDVEGSAELVVGRARTVVLLLSLVWLRLRLRRSLVALKLKRILRASIHWSAQLIVESLEVDDLCVSRHLVSRQLELAACSFAHLAAGEIARVHEGTGITLPRRGLHLRTVSSAAAATAPRSSHTRE